MTAAARRRPLEIGGWCKHMNGEIGKIIGIPIGDISPRVFQVEWQDGTRSNCREGFLEAVASEFAP